jgi:hypothetical protein
MIEQEFKGRPHRNPLGLVYDSGDYPTPLRRATELGDWARVRGASGCPGVARWRDLFVPRGDAPVAVDVRGTGVV